MNKRKLTMIGILVLVAVFGLFAINGLRNRGQQVAQVASRLSIGEAQTVQTVQRGDIVRVLTASGNLQPNRQIDMQFHTAGRVEEVFVSVGDRVEEGDELVRLNNRKQQLAYNKAKVDYELARIDATPYVIQEREYDMDMAKDELEQTILRAPFSGVITDVMVSEGESVAATDAVVQLLDDSMYKVNVFIDELDIAQIAVGQQAAIILDADPHHELEGVVEQVGWVAEVQQGVVTIPVTVRLNETNESLRPGFSSTVHITVQEARNVVRVPVEAVNEQGGQATVTKVVGDEREVVPVTTGLTDDVWVEIVSGLEEGDEIVGLNYRSGFFGSFGGGNGQRGNTFEVRSMNASPAGGAIIVP